MIYKSEAFPTLFFYFSFSADWCAWLIIMPCSKWKLRGEEILDAWLNTQLHTYFYSLSKALYNANFLFMSQNTMYFIGWNTYCTITHRITYTFAQCSVLLLLLLYSTTIYVKHGTTCVATQKLFSQAFLSLNVGNSSKR